MARSLHVEPTPSRRRWVVPVALAAVVTLLAAFAARPDPPRVAETPTVPQALPQARTTAHAMARAALPASPFGPGAPVTAEEPFAHEIRERNRAIDIARLTSTRPQLAEMLLEQVELQPQPRGGFVVRDVAAGSLGDRLGLRPGDVLLTIDHPVNAAVDEASLQAVMEQRAIALDVHRDGRPLPLLLALDQEAAREADAARDR